MKNESVNWAVPCTWAFPICYIELHAEMSGRPDQSGGIYKLHDHSSDNGLCCQGHGYG